MILFQLLATIAAAVTGPQHQNTISLAHKYGENPSKSGPSFNANYASSDQITPPLTKPMWHLIRPKMEGVNSKQLKV